MSTKGSMLQVRQVTIAGAPNTAGSKGKRRGAFLSRLRGDLLRGDFYRF